MKLSGKKIIKYSFIALLLGAASYGIWYSVGQYNLAKENITVCSDSGCIRTMHIHSDINMILCGNPIVFPRETGPLNGLHTHKEKNYLHFHDKVPLVSGENKLTFDKRLSLGEIFDTFPLDFVKLCGKPRSELNFTLMVNGEPAPEGLNYMWSNHDEITITTF